MRFSGVFSCKAFRVTLCVFLAFFLFSSSLFAQEAATIPDLLRRPERGEAPRYPIDLVIGELGRGEAPETAYRFASELAAVLISGSDTAPAFADSLAVLSDSIFEEIRSLEPRTFHLGGGKTETDGSVSFMVRFLGAEESLVGELYLRRREDSGTPAPAAATAAAEGEQPEAPPPESAETPPVTAAVEQPETPAAEQVSSAPAVWLLDDLILDERKPLNEITDGYRYDFSPYERFF